MNVEHQHDLVLRAVSHLRRIEQDPARAERTRAKCHLELQSRIQAAQRRESTRRRVEHVVVVGLSFGYFVALLGNLLRWRGNF